MYNFLHFSTSWNSAFEKFAFECFSRIASCTRCLRKLSSKTSLKQSDSTAAFVSFSIFEYKCMWCSQKNYLSSFIFYLYSGQRISFTIKWQGKISVSGLRFLLFYFWFFTLIWRRLFEMPCNFCDTRISSVI